MEHSQSAPQPHIQPETAALRSTDLRLLISAFSAIIAAVLLIAVGLHYRGLAHDAPLLTDSTLGELAVWMVDQSAEEAPPSLLGGLAKSWAQSAGAAQADLTAMLNLMQGLLLVWCFVAAALTGLGVYGLLTGARWTRTSLLAGLIGLDALLFFLPILDSDLTILAVIAGILLLLTALLFAPGKVTKVLGFVVVISCILVLWESAKAAAESINYAITAPQPAWTYSTYPTLEAALTALEADEITAVFADRNDLETLMPAYPEVEQSATVAYPDLRYLTRLELQEQSLIFPITPAMPGRLSIVVQAADAAAYTRPSQLLGGQIGAVEGDFAVERFLAVPRQMVLLDLGILNDLNLPQLQSISEAFLQPARRNGEFLLARILADAGLYTWREAVFGFGFGVIFGLMLGTAFAHSKLMERALLPYVVASQTVPILAIAPMVVIWLGASFTSVAVIAAYITFFPVTINTLRGLLSPNPMAVELMRSYAANWWTILWKLRFPAALPYIFTALKVSATASVVGAIIGELPSSMADGLGRAILNLSSDYSLVSTPKLWAAIITAAFVGITFFIAVSIAERLVLRRYVRSS